MIQFVSYSMTPTFLLSAVTLLSLGLSAFLLLREQQAKNALQKREQDISRRMYELAVLKEIGNRVGHSLDIQHIVDVISSSLRQFIEYTAVSFMIIEQESIVFKMHLQKSVHRRFVDDVRNKMLKSLSALLDRSLEKDTVKELISGAILTEDLDEPVESFFNIPLIIGGKVVGILTVADTKVGLYKNEEKIVLDRLIQQASKAVTRLGEAVRTEQEKISAMVESMEDGVVMTDAEYRILVINPAAKRVIGQESKNEVTIFDFIDNLGGKMDIRGRLEESVKLKKTYMSERFQIRERFYQSFVSPVRTITAPHGDEILGGVVIFHDVTREVELEHVRDDFTSMIVHELRTPLSGIQKASELLKKSTKKSETPPKQYIDIIYQNSSGMLDLVNDILDAAKLQAGKFEISCEPANVRDLLANRAEFFNISASDKKISLSVSVDESVPKAISFDIQRIKQVLNNLLSNALKFTANDGTVSIIAFVHNPGTLINTDAHELKTRFADRLPEDRFASLPPSLVISVSDSGAGIPSEHMGELFSKFKQLDNKAIVPNIKGTGLGLAIAKGIIEGHGGIIGVVSKVGVGSTFYFAIPLTPAQESTS